MAFPGSSNEIPRIDLSPLWQETESGLLQVSQALRSAYTTVGFAYIEYHNVPELLISAAFLAAKDFHSLPLEEKLAIKQNQFFRGYVPLNASTLKLSTLGGATKPNQLESFVMAHEVSKNDPDYQAGSNLAGPNQWPENLLEFKKTMMEYKQAMLILARRLVQAFSVSLGMPIDYLDRYFADPTYFLRLQYYPEQPDNISEDQYGIAPHTDYGFLTILAQDAHGGLQVKNQKGDWVDVPYLPGTLVLNSGDMLKRMSNDHYISTPHRVINRAKANRYSIPFFFEPNMHAFIAPLLSCVNAQHPEKYPPIEYASYLMARIKSNYNIGTYISRQES